MALLLCSGRTGNLGGRETGEVGAGIGECDGDGDGDTAEMCCCVPVEEVGIIIVVVQDCLVPSIFIESPVSKNNPTRGPTDNRYPLKLCISYKSMYTVLLIIIVQY